MATNFGELGRASVKVEASLDKLNRDFDRARQRTETFSRRADRSMDRFRASIERVNAAAAATRTRLAALAAPLGIGASLGAGVFVKAAKDALEYADALAKTSRALGLTVEQLQALQRGSELAGLSQQELEQGLRRLTNQLAEADRGEGRLAETVERLNIPLREQNGQFRSTIDILRDVADRIAAAESQQEKLGIAVDFFGRQAGPKFVELIGKGSASLDEMIKSLENSTHLTTEQTDAAERFNDAMTSFSRTIKDNFTVAVTEGVIALEELAKVIKELIPLMDALDRAVEENFGALGEFLTGFGPNIIENTKRELSAIKDFLRSLGVEIEDIQEKASEPLKVDIRRAAGFEPGETVPGETVPGTDPRIIPPSPAKPGPDRSLITDTFTTPIGDPEAELRLKQLQAMRELRKETDEGAKSFADYARAVNASHGPLSGLISLTQESARAEQDQAAAFASTVGFIDGALRGLFGDNKEFAIASAFINTALAVTRALSSAPPPINFVLAGTVAALGAAQIAAISGVEFEKGGVADRTGPITPFQHGAVISQRSAFPMADGGMGVMAEAGDPEAIMPLTRTSGGDLGVSAEGLPVLVQPELHFHNAPPVKETRRDPGGQRIDVVFDSMVAGTLKPGTQTSNTLKDRFGITPKGERVG